MLNQKEFNNLKLEVRVPIESLYLNGILNKEDLEKLAEIHEEKKLKVKK